MMQVCVHCTYEWSFVDDKKKGINFSVNGSLSKTKIKTENTEKKNYDRTEEKNLNIIQYKLFRLLDHCLDVDKGRKRR